MARLEITFERGAVQYTLAVDGLPNGVTDAEATNVAELLKTADAVESNMGGSGVSVAAVSITSQRTV